MKISDRGFEIGSAGVGFGVWWYVWDIYGFWWGILYGMFWPIWIGYRVAEKLLPIFGN